jgi:hypothetical protein
VSVVSPGDDRRLTGRKRRVLDRVVALRRTGLQEDEAGAATSAAPTPSAPSAEPDAGEAADGSQPDVMELEERLEALEAAFEGLQDAVHRESRRHERELADLRHEVQPANLARALSADARRRGI